MPKCHDDNFASIEELWKRALCCEDTSRLTETCEMLPSVSQRVMSRSQIRLLWRFCLFLMFVKTHFLKRSISIFLSTYLNVFIQIDRLCQEHEFFRGCQLQCNRGCVHSAHLVWKTRYCQQILIGVQCKSWFFLYSLHEL